MTGEDNSPLYYPCAWSGSVEYVHQECLLECGLITAMRDNVRYTSCVCVARDSGCFSVYLSCRVEAVSVTKSALEKIHS
ncbi:hypothetical protein BDL97_01G149100 [Sphagnum fallax]|jgi:hypothetical protein|nr:hypothetical protein BDL97_01G149100 [Sphagnum fallax]